MTYQCLKGLKESCFKNQDYQIVAIRPKDIENIRVWRNAQMDVLRQKSILTYEEQQLYFQKTIWPTFQQEKPNQILFSLLHHDICIGYGGLTYLDWENRRAEVSFLVDPIRAEDEKIYRQDFIHFLELLCQVSFEHLHFHRLIAETYAFRCSTIQVLERIGFNQEGILHEHVYKQGQWIDSIMYGLLANKWFASLEREKNQKNPHRAVLITSISKKVPLIHAVRSAANKLGLFQELHGADSSSTSLGQYEVDHFWNCPTLGELKPEMILDYCQKHQITAIIPTRDADVEFYARHLQFFHFHGIYPMVSPLETVITCVDKLIFAETLEKNHFPVIPAYLSVEQFDSSSYVVKERKGAGSERIGLNQTRQQTLEQSRSLKEPVFQPFIAGQEWSVDLYRTSDGIVKGCVARQRNFIVEGESQITTTQRYPALESLCQKIADHLKIYGHAIFQVIVDKKGSFHVVECNPRFGGASTASLAVGLDSFFWFLVECSGLNLEDYSFIRSKNEVRQIRHVKDRLFWL